MDKPKVSVITASLNQGKFIEETILSVLSQDYPNLEYLIIDGGSTDNTLDVIKKYEDRIDYWVSEPDKGQSDAINKGLKRVTGNIVTWINSDDQYYSEKIFSKVVEHFCANPDIDVCYGDNVYIDKNSSILYMRKGLPIYSRRLLNIWNYMHQPTVFLKREVIAEAILDIDLEYAMDYEYWLRISEKHKFKYINLLISASRWHDDSKTTANTDATFSAVKEIYAVTGKGLNSRIIPDKYLFKIFYNLQRLYTLPFLWQLNSKERFLNITVKSWAKLLKRQLLGLRFGG